MSQEFPKISIVTPSYNQGQFLEATIESVLSQNYPNLEYIIIDGGSTDGSVEIIKKYASHLHFWCSEPDKGQYDAINKGFAHATGEIMAWLNSDDMYFPWALKTVASVMSDLPQVEWLTTLCPGFWDWQGFCLGVGFIPGYSREAFLEGRYLPWGVKTHIPMMETMTAIQQESTFWRRSLWEKVGGKIQTEFKLAGDFDLWARFFLQAELYGLDSPLSGIRSQFSQKNQNYLEEYVIEAEKSLTTMRESLGWFLSPLRRLAFQLMLHKIPLLRTLVYKIPIIRKLGQHIDGYYGNKIIRHKYNYPDGTWQIKSNDLFYFKVKLLFHFPNT